MGVPARLHHYSFQDYLMVEEMNPGRHEFLDGDIYAMAGGTMLHAALSAAVLTPWPRSSQDAAEPIPPISGFAFSRPDWQATQT